MAASAPGCLGGTKDSFGGGKIDAKKKQHTHTHNTQHTTHNPQHTHSSQNNGRVSRSVSVLR